MVIDYTQSFKDAVIAQGKKDNVLIIRKLDKPFKRFDGKLGRYEVEHRWLSCLCEKESDQAWACTQGAEFTYWQRKEIKTLLESIKKGGYVNVFEHFSIF